MNEIKDLLIVRLGSNHDEANYKDAEIFFKEAIKSHIVIVIFGENNEIETKFETVYLK